MEVEGCGLVEEPLLHVPGALALIPTSTKGLGSSKGRVLSRVAPLFKLNRLGLAFLSVPSQRFILSFCIISTLLL